MTGLLVFALSLFASSSSLGMVIAKDSNFSEISREFSQGETVFVRVQSSNPGMNKREITLRDNKYAVIQSFTPQRSGFGPYSFTASFAAPQTPEFYSIESRIETAGSSDVDVKTIQIGKSSSANVNINTKISQKGQTLGEKTIPSSSPTGQPTPPTTDSPAPPASVTPSPSQPPGLFEIIRNFLTSIFQTLLPF